MELDVFGYLFDIEVDAIDELMEGEACGPIGEIHIGNRKTCYKSILMEQK